MITTIVTILFRFIHSILTNPYIPTTCHYSPLNENPPITSWLFGLTLACASHLFITTTRVVYSKKISFVANIILTFIVTGNTISILFSWLDEENSMCSDFLGVELSPYLIFEWFVTVPAMFLLVPFYSIISMEKQWTAIQSAIMGGLAILMLFLGNIPMPYGVNVFFLLVSTTLIASALTWQLLFTWSLYQEAVSELALFPSKKRLSEACIKASVKVDVTFNQFSLAAVMILVFTIFPLLYYLRMTRFLDFDTFTISIFGVSFLAKFLYSHVLFEVNNAVLDYSLSNTLDEKQRLAESREILLRFVFHEIRVPLNSLTLGIQCLKEKAIAESQSDDAVETEVLDMMEEGAKFMTETLNDVLSFQKIEDGALMLEKTWFDPRKLLKTISATFK